MGYPNINVGINQFGVVSNYDSVKLGGILLPITMGSLRGGQSLFVEHRKQKGQDFAKYVSQGLDTIKVGFQLNLFIDYAQNPPKNWLKEYEKIEKLLCPKDFDARNAVAIYHPSLAGKGITQVLPTSDNLVVPVGVDRWTVDFEGLDVRFIHNGGSSSGSVTKKVDQAPLRTSGPATLPKPSDGQRGKIPSRG